MLVQHRDSAGHVEPHEGADGAEPRVPHLPAPLRGHRRYHGEGGRARRRLPLHPERGPRPVPRRHRQQPALRVPPVPDAGREDEARRHEVHGGQRPARPHVRLRRHPQGEPRARNRRARHAGRADREHRGRDGGAQRRDGAERRDRRSGVLQLLGAAHPARTTTSATRSRTTTTRCTAATCAPTS